MKSLKLTSCMAENFEPVCRAIATHISPQLPIPVEFIHSIPWQEREQQLDRGEIQAGWICGLPYVWKTDRSALLELLVAPVMAGDRYHGQPVYFSDVVVPRDSLAQSFADLRGATWAYNEPRSHSGCYLTRSHLASLGEYSGFFGRAIESGAHQTSLQLILQGKIDATAIDSTVLELELRQHPEIASRIRIIATLGSSPIPPWVVSTQLPQSIRSALRQAFLRLHLEAEGRSILAQGKIARFVEVSDRDYDPIRRMARLAEQAAL